MTSSKQQLHQEDRVDFVSLRQIAALTRRDAEDARRAAIEALGSKNNQEEGEKE